MSHPIDVGSVLGGRYKVTATVLTSHDQDLVLDGVDQVLNRAVSILVAGPGNADQVAQSAREVATGERPGNVQILDLGVSEATTYLITNHTSAADLLDLVVSSNPPYVEPFFTDTLGSEIFGQPRSHEPETYDGLYDEEEVDAGYINYGQNQPAAPRKATPACRRFPRPARRPRPATSPPPVRPLPLPPGPRDWPPARRAGAAAAAAASKATSPRPHPRRPPPTSTAPQPVQGGAPGTGAAVTPQQPAPAEAPKVSLWSDDDYTSDDPRPGGDSRQARPGVCRRGRAAARRGPRPGFFPGSARSSDSAADDEYYGKDEEPKREPRSMRWLVGGLLAAVLVVGLVLAVTNLGSLFKTTPQPNAGGGTRPRARPRRLGAAVGDRQRPRRPPVRPSLRTSPG